MEAVQNGNDTTFTKINVPSKTALDCGEVAEEGGDEGNRDVSAGGGRRRKERVKGPWSPEEDTILSDFVSK